MTGLVSNSRLTVLVEQHSDGDSAHVEAIEEILHVLADHRVGAVGLLVLHHPLSHGGNDVIVSVSDLNDGVCETEKKNNTETGQMQPTAARPNSTL